MQGFSEVRDTAGLVAFLSKAGHFHDAWIKEARLTNRTYALDGDHDAWMERFDAHILWLGPFGSLSTVLLDTHRCRFDHPGWFNRLEGHVAGNPPQRRVRLWTSSQPGEVLFDAARLFWRLGPRLTGRVLPLGDDVPVPTDDPTHLHDEPPST